MMKSVYILCLIAHLLWHLPTMGQERLIHGKVTDSESSQPLPGANVFLKSNVLVGSTTDEEGKFSFSYSGTNVDTLMISFIGYRSKALPIEVNNNQFLAISLVPEMREMEGITITSENLIAEEFTIEKIEKMEIYTNPNAKADPILAVNSLPAASTTDESANISLRGSSPAETGIIMNNVPVYDAVKFSQLNGIGTFSIFNTALIENLKVFPGNPPLEYGNASSGLIALQTVGEVPKESNHSAILSLANVGINSIFKSGEKSAIILYANYQPSALLTKLNIKSLERLQRFNVVDAGIHFYSRLNSHQEIKIFNYTIAEGFEYKIQEPSFHGSFEQKKKRNFTIFNFRHQRDKMAFTLNQGLSFSNTQFNYGNTDLDIHNLDYFGSLNWQRLDSRLTFKSGLSFDYRKVNTAGRLPVFNYAHDAAHPSFNIDTHSDIPVLEVYGYLKYVVGEALVLGGGFRKNIPNTTTPDFLSYQANLHYDLNDKSFLNLSAGIYHKHVLAGQTFRQNTLIESRQLSLDYQYKSSNLEQHAAIFIKKAYFNDMESAINGFEFFTAYKIGQKFKVNLAYTFLNNLVEEGEDNYPGAYDLDYFIKGSLVYDPHPLWSFTTNFSFRQGTHFLPVTDTSFDTELSLFVPIYGAVESMERYPDYKIVDFSISKLMPIKEDFSLVVFGSFGNIFDFKNTRGYEYNVDYTERSSISFSRRVFYVGTVLNF